MKRRVSAIGLLLSIFLFIECSFITVALKEDNSESYIIVNQTGAGHFTTIQSAINNVLEGSTILIKSGIYSEIIEIKKKITIIGEDKLNTVINPISKENKYAIKLGAPEATIKNLSITNRAPGIYTTGVHISASGTQVLNCDIYDMPIGIAIWTSNNNINNCNFWGCEDEGIALLGSSYSDCNNNKITNCIFYDNCDGVELQHSSNNIISDCKFYDNTHTGIDAIASSNNENIISNCEIYNNKVNGIYLSSSSDNQIIDCSLSNNRDGDIMNTGSSYNNEIINSEPIEEIIEEAANRIVVESAQTYYESSKETKEKENIITGISNILFNLQMSRIINLLINF